MDFEVVMPRLGSEMTEGTINTWFIKEGEEVSKGDDLLEVQTDKAAIVVDSMVAGVLKKIIVDDQDTAIPVGQVIGVIEVPD